MTRINLKNRLAVAISLATLALFVFPVAGQAGFLNKFWQKAPKPDVAVSAPNKSGVAGVNTQPIAPQPPKVLKPVSSAKAAESKTAESKAQSNLYDFSAKKDPFKPFMIVKQPVGAGKSARINNGPVLPIHNFDISQFRLVGIITEPKGNRAMVVDPDKKAYVLKVGMTIGKNEGKITQIATTGIEVVEQFRDENNKIRKETIRIPLLRKP